VGKKSMVLRSDFGGMSVFKKIEKPKEILKKFYLVSDLGWCLIKLPSRK
jgi:hypothetical protein